MVFDLTNKGFYLAPGDTLFPFSQPPPPECAYPVSVSPSCQFSENVQVALEKCSATNGQKQQLGNMLRRFSAMFTECLGKPNVIMRTSSTLRTLAQNALVRGLLSVHKKALLNLAL